MAYSGWGDQGSVDVDSILVGDWVELLAVISAIDYQIGNVPNGVLEVGREYYKHEDTQWPRKMDKIFPIRTSFKFSGVVEEMHAQNISMLLGQTPNVGNTNYLYIGVLSAPVYFTLRGRRIRDADSFQIEFAIWKCNVTSLFQLGGADEAVSSPFEAEGLDDTAGGYGGSATQPLGFIYVPTKA